MTATRRGLAAPRLLLSAGLAVAVCAAASAAVAQTFQPFLEVHKTEAGYTVEAEDATLPQVLNALGKEAGFKVQDSGPARTAMPLFKVRDASLDDTLRKLLVSENHLIVYRGGSKGRIAEGSIEKIILLSPVAKHGGDRQPASSLAGPGGPSSPGQQRGDATARAPRNIPQNDPAAPMPDPEEVYRQVPGFDPNRLPPGLEPQAADELARQRLEQLAVDGVDPTDPSIQPMLPPGVMEQLESSGYTWDGEQAHPIQ